MFCFVPFFTDVAWRQCFAQDHFYFSVQPKSQTIQEGGSVTLECNVSDTRAISFSWTLSGQTLRNTTRRYQNGSHLHITRADRGRDSGEFKCIATNVSTGFTVASLAATLNILCKCCVTYLLSWNKLFYLFDRPAIWMFYWSICFISKCVERFEFMGGKLWLQDW